MVASGKPSTQEVEAGKSRVQSLFQLLSEFRASLRYGDPPDTSPPPMNQEVTVRTTNTINYSLLENQSKVALQWGPNKMQLLEDRAAVCGSHKLTRKRRTVFTPCKIKNWASKQLVPELISLWLGSQH